MKFASRDVLIPLSDLERHEVYATKYPAINGDQWDTFKASLSAGQRIAVVVAKLKERFVVIDGYQRWRALGELGKTHLRADVVAGSWWTMDEADRLKFVEDLNEHRRHLKFIEKVAKYKEAEKGTAGRPEELIGATVAPINSQEFSGKTTSSAEKAARDAGYGSVRAAQADVQLAEATVPEVHQAIDEKKITKKKAKDIAKLPKRKQKKALDDIIAGKFGDDEATKNGDDQDKSIGDIIKERNNAIESFCRSVMKFVEDNFPADEWMQDMNRGESALQKFRDGCSTLRTAKCVAVCPMCEGQGCKQCRKTGRVPKQTYDLMVK